MAKQPNWSIRPYAAGEEARIFELWKAVHPERNLQYEPWLKWWRWMYRQSPYDSEIWLADDNGRLAGQYCTAGNAIKYGDEIIKAAQSINILTHPDYRRQGVMLALAKQTYAELTRKGVKIIYGFPNLMAYPGFIKLGFSQIPDSKKLVRPFTWENIIRRYTDSRILVKTGACFGHLLNALFFRSTKLPAAEGLSVTLVDTFDDRIDDLWDKVSSRFHTIMVRRHDYLNWRFANVPGTRYDIFLAEKAGAVNGYLVMRTVEERHTRIARIYDILADSETTARYLIASAAEHARHQNNDYIAWVGKHNAAHITAFKKQGFRFRTLKNEHKVIAYPNDPNTSGKYAINPSDWILQTGDSDEL